VFFKNILIIALDSVVVGGYIMLYIPPSDKYMKIVNKVLGPHCVNYGAVGFQQIIHGASPKTRLTYIYMRIS
jgi:hypothetical protein